MFFIYSFYMPTFKFSKTVQKHLQGIRVNKALILIFLEEKSPRYSDHDIPMHEPVFYPQRES